MPKEFIDKHAQVGRPRLRSTVQVKTEPLKKSSSISNFKRQQSIRLETLEDGSGLKIDFSCSHSKRVRIQKDNAIALAKWILSNYE